MVRRRTRRRNERESEAHGVARCHGSMPVLRLPATHRLQVCLKMIEKGRERERRRTRERETVSLYKAEVVRRSPSLSFSSSLLLVSRRRSNNLTNMREIVHSKPSDSKQQRRSRIYAILVQAGQCGNQIGAKVRERRTTVALATTIYSSSGK